MDKRQKKIVSKFITVGVITALAVVAMVNFKDTVNRSEAIRTMQQIGIYINKYRSDNGFVPPESYVDSIRENLPGNARLGKPRYRGLWIDPESAGDEILAYISKNYRSLFSSKGYIVLTLDGTVKWMKTDEFEKLLTSQQEPLEKQIQN